MGIFSAQKMALVPHVFFCIYFQGPVIIKYKMFVPIGMGWVSLLEGQPSKKPRFEGLY